MAGVGRLGRERASGRSVDRHRDARLHRRVEQPRSRLHRKTRRQLARRPPDRAAISPPRVRRRFQRVAHVSAAGLPQPSMRHAGARIERHIERLHEAVPARADFYDCTGRPLATADLRRLRETQTGRRTRLCHTVACCRTIWPNDVPHFARRHVACVALLALIPANPRRRRVAPGPLPDAATAESPAPGPREDYKAAHQNWAPAEPPAGVPVRRRIRFPTPRHQQHDQQRRQRPPPRARTQKCVRRW